MTIDYDPADYINPHPELTMTELCARIDALLDEPSTKAEVKPMQQVKFGITFRFTDYCYSEISNFKECAEGIQPVDLYDRYLRFLDTFTGSKNTMVDPDVLAEFISDLENRAQIDYLEGHWDDDPDIMAGGKRFYQRAKKLRAIHPNL